jgi:hypothetical protein
MRRAFDIDVLACPRCGGRLHLLGVVEDPIAICQILTALALTADQANRAPPAVASPSIPRLTDAAPGAHSPGSVCAVLPDHHCPHSRSPNP